MSKAAELAALIGSQSAQGNRNLIINGAMQVSQRATSATGVGGNASYPTLDRFRQNTSNSAGRFTMSQVAVTDLAGFANALKLECTTADTSIASNEIGIIMQRFEGQDLQRLKKGTSSAEPVTVSFYVKGNASATYTLELADNDNDRQISQTFSVTTSWNRVSLTFAGDTSGVLGDDNGNSLELNFWIHAGSNFNSGTLSTTWTSTTNANRASSSATSFFDSTNRELFITGIQMEIGEQATPFEHRSVGDELAACQRYYTEIQKASGQAINTSQTVLCGVFPTEMRATPTASLSAALTIWQLGIAGSKGQSSSNISVNSTINSGSVFNAECGNFSSLTLHTATAVAGGDQPLKFDAEL